MSQTNATNSEPIWPTAGQVWLDLESMEEKVYAFYPKRCYE